MDFLTFGAPQISLVVVEGVIASTSLIAKAAEGITQAKVLSEMLGNGVVAEEEQGVEENSDEWISFVTSIFPQNDTSASREKEVVEEKIATEGSRNFKVVFLHCCSFCFHEIGVIAHKLAWRQSLKGDKRKLVKTLSDTSRKSGDVCHGGEVI